MRLQETKELCLPTKPHLQNSQQRKPQLSALTKPQVEKSTNSSNATVNIACLASKEMIDKSKVIYAGKVGSKSNFVITGGDSAPHLTYHSTDDHSQPGSLAILQLQDNPPPELERQPRRSWRNHQQPNRLGY